MRRIVVLALALAPFASTPAGAQVWKDYSYPDLGFTVHFPAEPTRQTGDYRSLSAAPVPSTSYTARHENAVYTVTVADFSGAPVDKDKALDDAVKVWSQVGEIKLDVVARINSEFGRELSVRDRAGGHWIVAIFYIGDRLYELNGRAPPPGDEALSARLLRFQQSLNFTTAY